MNQNNYNMESRANSGFLSRNSSCFSNRSDGLSTRLSSRLNTSSSYSRCSTSSNDHSNKFISGETIKQGGLRSLSSLYRPNYKKIPTFPSIYETKYQRDFQYIPFPKSKNYKETQLRSDYSGFKFGETTNKEAFKKIEDTNNLRVNVIPFSRNRRNNPQPRMQVALKYPNQHHWVWSHHQNERSKTVNLQQKGYTKDQIQTKMHRWNSR